MSKKTDELPVRSTKIERNHLELILCGKILQRLVLLLNNIVVVKKCPELTKMTKTKKTTRKNFKKLKQQQKKQIVPRESTENRRDRHISFISYLDPKVKTVLNLRTQAALTFGKRIH